MNEDDRVFFQSYNMGYWFCMLFATLFVILSFVAGMFQNVFVVIVSIIFAVLWLIQAALLSRQSIKVLDRSIERLENELKYANEKLRIVSELSCQDQNKNRKPSKTSKRKSRA
jgi:Flp pilus assembly protein TadB